MTYIYLVANILLLVVGQILFKVGLKHAGGLSAQTIWRVLFSPYILGGLCLYAVATAVWFLVLDRLPLSVAYPLQSVAYVLGMIVALLIFKEHVPPIRWMGAIVIMLGVALVARQ